MSDHSQYTNPMPPCGAQMLLVKENRMKLSEQIEWVDKMIKIGADTHSTPKMESILNSLRRLQSIEEAAGMPPEPQTFLNGPEGDTGVKWTVYDELRAHAIAQGAQIAELRRSRDAVFERYKTSTPRDSRDSQMSRPGCVA